MSIAHIEADDLKKLESTSREAKDRAYCPYSNFHVGAAILMTDGTIVRGANIENASYPVSMCAERVALGTAVATHGLKRGQVQAIGIASDLETECSPCGMCRQALREFADLSTPIFLYRADGAYTVMAMQELLPMSFGPDSLPPAIELSQRARK